MPNYKPAANQPYDSRVLSEDADSFTTSHPVTGETVTFPKNQGLLDKVKEGFTTDDKMGQKLDSIRRTKGWQKTGKDS